MNANDTGLLNSVKELWEKCPDEVKECTKFVPGIVSEATTFGLCFDQVPKMKNLQECLKNPGLMSKTDALTAVNNCKQDFVICNQDGIKKCLTTNDVPRDHFINGVKNSMTTYANTLLYLSIAANLLSLVVEVIHIYNVWEKVKECRNMLPESAKTREIISRKIDELLQEIRILDKFYANANEEKSEHWRTKTTGQIIKLERKLAKIKSDLGTLEVNINGKKMMLINERKQLKYRMLGGIINGAFSGLNLGILAPLASPLVAIGAGVVAGVGLLINLIGNSILYNITSKDIKKIQAEVEEIEKITIRFRDIEKCLVEASDEIIEEFCLETA